MTTCQTAPDSEISMTRTHTSPLSSNIHPSPVGELTIVVSDDGVAAILWPVEREGRVNLPDTVPADERRSELLARTVTQLDEYFAGARSEFDLPLELGPVLADGGGVQGRLEFALAAHLTLGLAKTLTSPH